MLKELQTRILYSLKLQKVLYDIHHEEKNKHVELKKSWAKEWQSKTQSGFNANDDFFIEDEEAIYGLIKQELIYNLDSRWLYLVAMELCMFSPYYPLCVDYNKSLKKITINSSYEKDQFCRKQSVVVTKDLDAMCDLYRKYRNSLSNRTKKVLSGVAVSTLATAATGGLAWTFAPQIAVLLAGGSVAGLSGAALTSASLAAIGGGSLAVGGLGIAGGIAIITGGGALLGVAGSSVASISKAMILTSKGYTMNECAKLLTYCKYVLIEQYGRKDIVCQLQKLYGKNILQLEQEIPEAKNENESINKSQKKETKESLKYLKQCNSLLIKMIE